MLYIIYRCMWSRLRQFMQFFLLVGCFLPLGCGGEQEHPKGERLVSVKLTSGTGTQKVQCSSLGGIYAGIRAKEAERAGKDCYEIPTFDGDLLMVEMSGKADKSKDETGFPYIFSGDEKMPLVFSHRPGLTLLNGEVICVDLADKAGAQWIAHQPDAKLKTIRTLLLGGDAAANTAALKRMDGSGITVDFSYSENNPAASKPAIIAAEVCEALIAVKPACCIFGRVDGIDGNIIAQLTDLTHLVIYGEKIPDLTGLKKLRFLCLSHVTTLAPLANLTQLRGFVAGCDGVADFTPLRKLTRLRTLHIGGAEKLADLDVFADMRDLRSLTLMLGDKSKIKSIAPIAELTNLTELAIVPIPPTVKDLSALKKLKNLKTLVVDKDGLEERQEEYDEIRKALPECQVVGFCMGSAWILLVVPAAVGLGVWRRRRSAMGKAA